MALPQLTKDHIAADLDFMRSIGAFDHAVEAARSEGIPPAIFLGIASRESRGGRLIDGSGWRGDGGHGYSIWHVDDRAWPGYTACVDPSDHTRYAYFAAGYLSDLKEKLGTWEKAVAAYNAGVGGVRRVVGRGLPPDAATTRGNYASDISRRARLVRELHPELAPAPAEKILKAGLPAAAVLGLLALGYKQMRT